MKKIFLSFLTSSIVFCSLAQIDNPDCLEKSTLHFSPMDGFYLEWCNYAEFGSYDFLVDRGSRSIKKEGVYLEIWFRKKEENTRVVSGIQILQNHVNAIKAAGGEVLNESDGNIFKTTHNGKELWIFVNANTNSTDQDNYGIFSVEVDVVKQEVSALDINGSMDSQGKIALYGILFDTGKSDIKPESEKTISSIATFLKENSGVNVYIVGHTDNVGDDVMNQSLSLSRAESVIISLTSKYGIAPIRLTGRGVGPYCPITSNDTEEGRTLNRRVEIVKK